MWNWKWVFFFSANQWFLLAENFCGFLKILPPKKCLGFVLLTSFSLFHQSWLGSSRWKYGYEREQEKNPKKWKYSNGDSLFISTEDMHEWESDQGKNLNKVDQARDNNREIKLDVTWSNVKRQTAKLTSEFVFFSANPSLNHIKIEKCLLLFATNTNIFTLRFKELKTDGKSFIFAVCRLTNFLT